MKAFSNNNLGVLPSFKFFALGLAVSLFVYCASDLRLNTTASMPQGIYRTSEANLERGSQVEICIDGDFAEFALERGYLRPGRCESGTMPLVKALAGLPGDEINIVHLGDRPGIQVNGILLPKSEIKPFDSQGRPMASRLKPGVIPLGKALVISRHDGGFDSRYFGLVDLRRLKKVNPLITF